LTAGFIEGLNIESSWLWFNDPKGGRKPINAKFETVRDLPTFREAYRKRRCIVPVDGFFEWKAIKGQKVKQPYASR
jgi:putative SOS response-associated peptidase YedK